MDYKPIQPYPLHFDQVGGPLQFMPQYWINGGDLKHRVRFIHTNDPNYFTLADVDLNMNMSCRCKQELGWTSEGGGMFIPGQRIGGVHMCNRPLSICSKKINDFGL